MALSCCVRGRFAGNFASELLRYMAVAVKFKFFYHNFFYTSGTFPIDLTKTRLQVQGQSQYTEVRYKGMFHALYRIGREEGVRALYSG